MILRKHKIISLNGNNRFMLVMEMYVFCEVRTEFICTFERPYVSKCQITLDLNKTQYLYVFIQSELHAKSNLSLRNVLFLCFFYDVLPTVQVTNKTNVIRRRRGLFYLMLQSEH